MGPPYMAGVIWQCATRTKQARASGFEGGKNVCKFALLLFHQRIPRCLVLEPARHQPQTLAAVAFRGWSIVDTRSQYLKPVSAICRDDGTVCRVNLEQEWIQSGIDPENFTRARIPA